MKFQQLTIGRVEAIYRIYFLNIDFGFLIVEIVNCFAQQPYYRTIMTYLNYLLQMGDVNTTRTSLLQVSQQ